MILSKELEGEGQDCPCVQYCLCEAKNVVKNQNRTKGNISQLLSPFDLSQKTSIKKERQNWMKSDRVMPIECSRAKVASGLFCAIAF